MDGHSPEAIDPFALTDRPSASIVVVSFNTRDHLRACLESAIGQDAVRIVVADNGSTDGSIELVERDFPSVLLSVDRTNPGYGAGANRGIALCDGDVLLLNSDTRLAAGALDGLHAYLRAHDRAGIVGPRLVDRAGRLQPSTFRFPSLLRPPVLRDPLVRLVRRVPGARERYLPTWSHTRTRTVPYVMGAALMIRRAAFDPVGGFDESFFMYAEEIDLCWRLRCAGWETHFAPVTDVVHEGRASTRQQPTEMLEQSAVSSIRFYKRRYSGLRLGVGLVILRVAMAARIARDLLRYLWTRDAGRRRGLAENVRVWRRVLSGRSVAAAR